MPDWKIYHKADLQQLTRTRAGETKIGETLSAGLPISRNIQCVILGIPEDIGVRANHGIGGASTAWDSFLSAFLNVQSTVRFSGENCCILGELDCRDLSSLAASGSVEDLRKAVTRIDLEVEQMISKLFALGKLPIVIGGGHNNAYPLIRSAARGLPLSDKMPSPKINVINLDAHTDFRPPEGRHSGNGFRYAFQEGFLDRYAMIGLHRNYNAQSIIDEIAGEKRISYSFWEDIFLEEKMNFKEAVFQAIDFTKSGICGIELDLDAVENILASAQTPSGITPTMARQYIHYCAGNLDPAYLHICEGAVQLDNGKTDPNTGKLIAYLVSDFIRALR